MRGADFIKMHGLGNDFVVLDARAHAIAIDAEAARAIADRHRGVGCDQLIVIEPARDPQCAFAYNVWNTDGTRSGQCGNGLRCVARWLQRAGVLGAGMTRLESPSGPVTIEQFASGEVCADMGEPRFAPAAIPIRVDANAVDDEHASYAIDVAGRRLHVGAVSMGNPHALVEVDDIAATPVEVLGAQIECADAFPQGCNVGFAQVLARDVLALRVWERGVGETLACGSGACAAVALLRRRGKLDDDVRVKLPGGELGIHWKGPGHPLWMRGPAAFVFEGELSTSGNGATESNDQEAGSAKVRIS